MVMDSTAVCSSKLSKVDNLLSIFSNEVDTTIKLLYYLKQHSLERVENLRRITSSSVFLKEYLEINSLLLKYLDFLTEINCKFEILQTHDKEENNVNLQNSTPVTVMELKSSSKFGRDCNFNCSSINSTLLSECVTCDYLSDISNSTSSEGSGKEKVSVKFNNKNYKKLQKLSKVFDKKKPEKFQNEIQSSNSYSDKQIRHQGLEEEFSSGDKVIEGVNNNETYSSTKNEEKILEQCFGREGNFEKISNKVEFKIEEIPEDLSAKLHKCNKYLEGAKNSNTTNSSAPSPESCNDELYEIKPINIPRKTGEEYEVIVEHIISPSEFYVYILQNYLNKFIELEEKLKLIEKDSILNKKRENKDQLSKLIGKYALYYSKCDEKWCRAKVTDWRLNQRDDLVYIYLVDYGESKCVTVSDIQTMPDSFKLYPAFIQRCHLSGIFPTELNLSSKTLPWSKASIEKMKCVIDTSSKIKIKIAPEDIHHPAKSLPVTLWLTDQDDTCVNELLIKSQHAQLAQKAGELKNNSESENLESWNPMKEDFESHLNSYDLDMKDPAAVIYGYIGMDYERICKHFAKTGKCFKGDSCKKEHIPLNPSGFTTDKEEVYKNAVNSLPLPPPKSIISVQVTCILSANIFCCIRDETPWASEEETLQSLVEYMNSKENILNMQKLLIPPSVGQIVIAKYSLDNSWYRAKILESQPESDHYLVLFVDYGNKEVTSLHSIRGIEGRYLHLPFQGLQCCIFGITHNPRLPVKEYMNYLNKRLTEGLITLEIVATFPGDHPKLLVHVFDKNGKNIATDLIEKNYAVLKQELIVNSDSTFIPG